MMLSVILGSFGVLFLVLAWQLGKKERIGLIQEYHRDQVTEADQKRFCALCGMGMCAIGTGMILTAILYVFSQSMWCLLAFAGGFLLGLGLLIRAVRKYNR